MSGPQQVLPEGIVQRRGAYYSDFQVRSRRIRRKLSRSLTVARQLVIELRARAERGELGLIDNDVSVDELKGAYLKACGQEAKPDTLLRYRCNLAAILPHMPRRVSQITTRALHDYRQRRSGRVSPRTINSDVDTLCRMLRWGKTHGIIGSNPLDGLKALPHDHPKEGRALEDAEVNQLLQASPQHWHDVWYSFLVTGMRQRELAGLRLSDIDWEARELIVQRSVAKTHRSRRIPIDGSLWDLFCQRRAEAGDQDVHVFQNRRGGPLSRGPVYRAFIRCCRRAGLQTRTVDAQGHEVNHLDVHSLRKTFATNLIVHRTDPKTVMELLGHTTVAITLTLYAKIHPGTKREAIGRLSYGAGTAAPAVIKLADSG